MDEIFYFTLEVLPIVLYVVAAICVVEAGVWLWQQRKDDERWYKRW